eukprot:TCALIF_09314-PA protein Name:"Similar to Best3 Bestrophin-3 (Mus musculus)" AED:0.15 eAED:0.16 QI:0/0.2/0/1/0.6/0.5/6/0/983
MEDTNRRFHGIFHLLLVWRGSIFKLIWHDVLAFGVMYFLLSLVYRSVLIHYPAQREMFEIICVYAGRYGQVIPISFLTGFFVTQVVSRWWDQFMSLPWPDKVALKLVSFVPGKDPFRKNLRRTVMRYVNLSTILVYRLVSLKAKKRFSTYQDLVDAKLVLPHEVDRMLKADERTPHELTWLPLLWAMKLLQRARTEGKITLEPPAYVNLISSFDYIETCNRKILNYGWVNFPLAYTQVASVSVFLYFLAALFGRQYLIPHDKGVDGEVIPLEDVPSFFSHLGISYTTEKPFDKHTPDFIFPFFTFVELLSYMGWIKVAECLLNPFGDDDEDFKVNYMIDRNLQVSYIIVDEAEEDLEILEDPFSEAGISIPPDLPYKDKNAKPSIENATIKTNLHQTSSSVTSGLAPPSYLRERFRDSLRSGDSHISTESNEETKPFASSTITDTEMNAMDSTTDNTLYVSLPETENSIESGDHTLTPTEDTNTNKRFRGFWHLMAMWKGSVLKLIWHDLLVFMVMYSILSAIYRFWLFGNAKHREAFELVCVYASRFRGMIPITFLTGFYVSQVVSRYWDQFMSLPFTDQLAYKLVTFVPGNDVYRKNLRRTVMRYANLSIIFVYRLVSSKVRKRFPTFDSMVDAKVLLPQERDRLIQVNEKSAFELTWVPISWALKAIQQARTSNKITIEAPIFSSLVGEFDAIEAANRKILNYGWVNFPLAYTQVATLSVFSYFFSSLFACQYLIPEDKTVDTETFPHLNVSFSTLKPFDLHTPDIYVPVFTILEFISYMGWIKVAEALLNPFGDDDDDFQINYLIDRNLTISYLIVEEGETDLEDVKDPFLSGNVPPELPYNDESLIDESTKQIGQVSADETTDQTDSNGGVGLIIGTVRKISNASFGRLAPNNRSGSSHGTTMSINFSLAKVDEAEIGPTSGDSGFLGDTEMDVENGHVKRNHLEIPTRSERKRKVSPHGQSPIIADFNENHCATSKL